MDITPYEASTCKKKNNLVTQHLHEQVNNHKTYIQVSVEPSNLSLLSMSVNCEEEQLTVDQIYC